MSTQAETGGAALPLALERQVDAACRRFEAAWRAGRRPHPKDYLSEGPGRQRNRRPAGCTALSRPVLAARSIWNSCRVARPFVD
jgi:hypothetical protein